VKPADTPDFVQLGFPNRDRHSSGPLVTQAARCYLPANDLRDASCKAMPHGLAYLVLLRVEIARFTRT